MSRELPRLWPLTAQAALQVAESTPTKGHPYKEWITTYGSPEFEELPRKQEELLNAVGPAQPYGEGPPLR